MDFYERFLDLCSEKGLSPAAAAREIGLSNATATHWAHGTVPTSTTARKVANFFGVSVDYLLGKVSGRAESLSGLSDDESSSDETSSDDGEFKFDRFCDLCKQNGRKQSYLYKLVGMPDKSGSNLRRTKNVKPEILEIWAKELHTTAAYLNGETDDPSPVSSSFRYDRLDDLIDKKHLTRKALCLETGHADNYIRMFEKRGTEPPRDFVNFCAQKLGTTSAYLYGETDVESAENKKSPAAGGREVTDDDIKFALFGGGDVTDAQFEEVRSFARFVKERDANGQSK